MKIKSALTLGRTGFSREEACVTTSHFTECTHCFLWDRLQPGRGLCGHHPFHLLHAVLFCGTGFSREEACVATSHFTECTRCFLWDRL